VKIGKYRLMGFMGLLWFLVGGTVFAQLPVDIPRNELLILDQIFRYSVAENFNVWLPVGPPTPTRQALITDTLWYIDQQTGEWINSLAKSEPRYNDDFTQMVVELREGIYWSDGEPFTADDVVFTVKTLMANPGMNWSATLSLFVREVYKRDDYTVVFELKEPNSRFHTLFTARYNAIYIMPEHVWSSVASPMQFRFWPPVSLGAYVVRDADPAGYWELFELREDWERTTVGQITGKPGPKYILTIFYGPNERKVIAMAQHELDLLIDLDIEAFLALMERSSTARSWYPEFPYAWPDELDVRFIGFNLDRGDFYSDPEVRWALTLALDIVELQTEYIGGVARVTPIPQPGTPLLSQYYHKPLEPWLRGFTIDVAGEPFQPYDDTVPERIAAWARAQGYDVPDDPEVLEALFGIGWWKHAPDVAEKILLSKGFTRNAQGRWLTPSGEPWRFNIIAPPDEVDTFRLALGAADQWTAFGIEVDVEAVERDPYYARNSIGDFVATSSWGEGGGGAANAVVDKWQYMQGFHTRYYRPTGTPAAAGNILRVRSEELDRLIDELGALSPDDPAALELNHGFMKLWVENMWSIPLVSFKKFITFDEFYWTNFPTSENPYGQPLYWFVGSRFVLPHLEPTGR